MIYLQIISRSIMGRCSRRRTRIKCLPAHEKVPETIKMLYKWMSSKTSKIKMSSVTLKTFPDSGRGFMATREIEAGELLISVPSEYFITTSSILQSPIKNVIESFRGKLSPMEALSLFLLFEKSLEDGSPWFPYLNSLPESFHYFWRDEELKLLPSWVIARVEGQKKSLLKSFQKLKKLLSIANVDIKFEKLFNLENYLWARSVVSSRSAYMTQPRLEWLDDEPDCYVLVPFLDMFNHTTAAKVEAGYNVTSKCYDIKTDTTYKKFDQVFINYGPHDNVELLILYGFVIPHNPLDFIDFSIDEVVTAVKEVGCLCGNLNKKLKIIASNRFENYMVIWLCGYGICLTTKGFHVQILAVTVQLMHNDPLNLPKHPPREMINFLVQNVIKKIIHRYMLISKDGISWNLSSAIKVLCATRDVDIKDGFISAESESYYDGIVHKVVKYLISSFKLLPTVEKNGNSYNNLLAYELTGSFKNIINFVVGSLETR